MGIILSPCVCILKRKNGLYKYKFIYLLQPICIHLVIFLTSIVSIKAEEEKSDRKAKICKFILFFALSLKFNKIFVYFFSVPIFQVVRFPNDICVIDGGSKNGTCYTA